MFTEERINEILEICNKATEGPWKISIHPAGWIDIDHPKDPSQRLAIIVTKDDAQFIALSRTVLPQFAEDYRKLLAVAEAAEKLLQERPPCPHCDGFAHPKECICEPWDLLHGALVAAGYGGEE